MESSGNLNDIFTSLLRVCILDYTKLLAVKRIAYLNRYTVFALESAR